MPGARFFLGLCAALLLAGLAAAADQPLYDENANAHQQVAAALVEGAKSEKNIVLIFGANW